MARRFEFRGEYGGVTFVDDYAHLPREVPVALDAALGGGFERVVCVFQPHRYSRVASLATGFADSFVGADLVVVTDIYPSGEMPRPGVSARLVLDAIVACPPRRGGGLRAEPRRRRRLPARGPAPGRRVPHSRRRATSTSLASELADGLERADRS